MPKRVHRLIARHDTVQHGKDGYIALLKDLLVQDDATASARLCHPNVQYIGKMNYGVFHGEGNNFCGYHNIQMQISCIRYMQEAHCTAFDHGVPSILCLQDLIEAAWDEGINAHGRVQTGGIRNTRKHIGTSEAQALFTSLGIMTKANVFIPHNKRGTTFEQLLQFVNKHFTASETTEGIKEVVCTDRPPIYLQCPGHSMTIVGIAIDIHGDQSLLVFDPAIAPPKQILDLSTSEVELGTCRKIVKCFRKSKRQMRNFTRFETLYPVKGHLR